MVYSPTIFRLRGSAAAAVTRSEINHQNPVAMYFIANEDVVEMKIAMHSILKMKVLQDVDQRGNNKDGFSKC